MPAPYVTCRSVQPSPPIQGNRINQNPPLAVLFNLKTVRSSLLKEDFQPCLGIHASALSRAVRGSVVEADDAITD